MAPSERRVVTVLFADLVGFTSLSERLDAEDVALVQGEYFRTAREAIETRLGQVEKFIGDAVMSVFGVHQARDRDADQAVAAALAIVDGVAGLGASLGLPPDALQVRVGVNTGEVLVVRPAGEPGGWRVTGDAVNVAARLQAAADPGTVLVGPDTALAVASAFATEAVGPFELKGKTLPMPAWRVVAPRDRPSRESALHGLSSSTLGRERELAWLEQRRADAGEQAGALVVVAPPGVGKTRLVAEFGARVEAAGGTVWRASASLGTPSSYEVVAALLRQAWGPERSADEGGRAVLERLAALGHTGPRAALSVDHAMALLRGLPVDAAPVDLWTSWTAVLDACAADGAPVWVVEDVHLAGPDQRAFLAHAVAQPHRRGRLVVMTARPAILGPEDGDGLGNVPVMFLEPLDEDDAARLVEALAGPGAMPAEIARAAAVASGGNPLFVEEVLRSWVHTGALRREENGTWQLAGEVGPLAIPSTIRAVYLAQLDDLPERPRRVVEAGSVPGTTFPSRALPVLGIEDPRTALDLLTGYGLLTGPHADVVDTTSYTYRHALLRDAAYGVLPRSARARLHVRFAEWVADTVRPDMGAEIVGEHLAAAFEEAPALGRTVEGRLTRDDLRVRAADWLERAARLAMAAAPQRAIQLLDRSLALTDAGEVDATARRNERLGEALRRSGRLEDAMRVLAAAGADADQAGDPEVAAAAALGYEDALFESRLPRDTWGATGLRLLRNALAAPAVSPGLRSRLLAARGRAEAYGGRRDEGEASCLLAVDAARRASDDGALAYALLSLRAARSGPEDLHDRLRCARELVEAAERAGDVESHLEGVRLEFVDLLEAGDAIAASAAQVRAEELVVLLRRPLYLWYPAMWRAMMALFAGDLDAAAALVEEFREDGRRWHYRDVELVHAVQLAELHAQRGTPAEALGALRRVAEAAPERFAPSLSACFAAAGRMEEAAGQLAVHASHGFATLPRDLSLGYSLSQSVVAAAAVGDQVAAAQLRTLLARWEGHNVVLGSGALSLGAASHYLGVAARTVGDVDDAVSKLSDAVTMNDAMGAGPATSRSRLELARALFAAGRLDEGRDVAAAGVAVARRIGMSEVAEALAGLVDGRVRR